jgi:carbamoyltransferase
MKIVGLWSGHDCSFCVLENGIPTFHAEYERYIREKEPSGDSIKFLFDKYKNLEDVDYYTSMYPRKTLSQYPESLKQIKKPISYIGHHQSHAANAFYSSNFEKSIIVTLDGGGIENDENGRWDMTAGTIWKGNGNKIEHSQTFSIETVCIGSVWTRCTRYIFGLQSGWPYGHQAGTVMALAALGNPEKYYNDFLKMLTSDLLPSSKKPSNQPVGPNTGNDPIHPYLDKWVQIAKKDEQAKYDMAAALQKATEDVCNSIIDHAMKFDPSIKNLCLSGGVFLNSVIVGKLLEKNNIENIFVVSTPHDGGLCIGSCQYHYHHVLNNPRIKWNNYQSPYLGEQYSNNEIFSTIKKYEDKIEIINSDVSIVNLLNEGNIISVFNKGSESGRRALGNRSILADPRPKDMKENINEKVKHRQWFRPFAPSVLREYVDEWFERDIDSPYMSFVLKFKEDKKDKVPAVVHLDGTARLQTVTENDNKWYYNLLKEWNELTGIPMLVNTSFNDREPICETPDHAMKCFLGTDIDYLYFVETKTLVRKK